MFGRHEFLLSARVERNDFRVRCICMWSCVRCFDYMSRFIWTVLFYPIPPPKSMIKYQLNMTLMTYIDILSILCGGQGSAMIKKGFSPQAVGFQPQRLGVCGL